MCMLSCVWNSGHLPAPGSFISSWAWINVEFHIFFPCLHGFSLTTQNDIWQIAICKAALVVNKCVSALNDWNKFIWLWMECFSNHGIYGVVRVLVFNAVKFLCWHNLCRDKLNIVYQNFCCLFCIILLYGISGCFFFFTWQLEIYSNTWVPHELEEFSYSFLY